MWSNTPNRSGMSSPVPQSYKISPSASRRASGPRATVRERAEQAGELVRGDRLGEMGVEAGLERAALVVDLSVSRDRDQDRIGAAPGADAARHLISVQAGQADVDQDDIGPHHLVTVQPTGAVGGLGHPVTLVLEQRAQALSRVVVVLDQQYVSRWAACGGGRGSGRRGRLAAERQRDRELAPAPRP